MNHDDSALLLASVTKYIHYNNYITPIQKDHKNYARRLSSWDPTAVRGIETGVMPGLLITNKLCIGTASAGAKQTLNTVLNQGGRGE